MNTNRRDFLKTAAAGIAAWGGVRGASGAGQNPSDPGHPATGTNVVGLITPKLEVVRFGMVGVGSRGTGQLKGLLLLEGVEVRAVCDIDPVALAGAVKLVKGSRGTEAAAYGDGPEAFRKLLERDDLDAVLIATPWNWHVPIAVAAMEAGKHAFVEVPAAATLEDCWRLVETAEKTRRHCMMLENCCYGRDELMVLNLCRQGLFGDLLHGEGAYLHDLRFQLKSPHHSEGLWRPWEATKHNGNLYPTHGLGPVAQYLGINRGDRFGTMVSMSNAARGLAAYAEEANLAPDNPYRKAKFICGDMNTSIVKTARNRTILVQHDTFNARPYSRLNLIQGTKGIFAGYPNRISIEGRTPDDEWDLDMNKWYAEYDHPLWKAATGATSGATGLGHGGMDHVMRWRLVECLRKGLPLDQDVYDAAAWCVIGPLSEKSVAQGGAPVDIPDFTRGAWKTTAPLGVVS